MAKREFVQLAQTYDKDKHRVGGYYVSEKLDGVRAYWDGGWTRGLLTSQVPFANTVKDFRRISPPHSTGLWSRYGKPIAAPDWWLNKLPPLPLDGELFMGRGKFQQTVSIVKRFNDVNVSEWEDIDYRIFDLPSDYEFLSPGRIYNPQWEANFEDMRNLAPPRLHGPMSFHKVVRMLELNKISLGTGPAKWQPQIRAPHKTEEANLFLTKMLDEVTEKGGEGLILRKPESVWTPRRTWDLLKVKPWHDSEAEIIGYKWGKGKLRGLMGSLTVTWDGKVFDLSGFTNEERRMDGSTELLAIDQVEGEKVNDRITNIHFPRGSLVTFKYRELTDDGLPKEARYWRKANLS